MIVYKYLPAKFAMLALRDERLKVGIASQQNDIFDCFPIIQAGPDPNDAADRALTSETLKAMNEAYGIISFSKNPDSLLLWAHYGDSHKGIVLGIEFPEAILPRKTRYLDENRRERLQKVEIEGKSDGNPYQKHDVLFSEGFNVKGPDWKYEDEYRHFVRLSGCPKEDGLYFQKLDRSMVKEVILGARCQTQVEDVYRAMNSGYRGSNFKLFFARQDEIELKMNLKLYSYEYERSWFWSA